MAKYEGLFLLDNSRVKADAPESTGCVTEVLKKHNATVAKIDRWDERKLAFEIKKQKRGSYVLTHFEMDAKEMEELRRAVALNEDILRSLILRVETEAFPTFMTASEYEALRPKREEDDRIDEGGRRDDGERRGRGREEEVIDELV